jgi:Ca2+-binding EF-hand superfamily protein
LKHSTMVTGIAAAALLGGSLTSVVAADPGDAMRSFGLIGVWSPNCVVPPGTLGAIRTTYDAPKDGRATFTSTSTIPIANNPQASVLFEIDDATLLSDKQIKLIGKFTKLSRTDGQTTTPPDVSPRQIIIEKVDAQIHIIDNRLLDGTSVAIDAGIMRATGKPALLVSKCETVGVSPASSGPPAAQNKGNISLPPAQATGALPGQPMSPSDYLLSRLNPKMTLADYLKRMRGEFRMADADANGEISEADGALLAQIQSANFRTMYLVQLLQADLDGDGVVTEDEIRRFLTYRHHSSGAQPIAGKTIEQTIEDQIKQIMVADADHDGRITFAEALNYANALPDIGAFAGSAVHQLRALAPQGQSTLRLADLEAEAEKLFHEVDANGDGVVSADELQTYRAAHSAGGAR